MGFRRSQKKNESWEHPSFWIGIIEKHSDGAYKTIQMKSTDLPGLVGVGNENTLELSCQHCFRFSLPREYPQNLGKIQIIPETPLFHPRITAVGTKACYTVNGEVDRVLIDIIYNVLLRPETVRPPSMFKDADWGLDSRKMRWYIQYGPEKIYQHLKQEWHKKQQSKTLLPSTPKKKIKIL